MTAGAANMSRRLMDKRLQFIAPPQWRTALRTRTDRGTALGHPLDTGRHLPFESGIRDRVAAGSGPPGTRRFTSVAVRVRVAIPAKRL